MTTERPPAAIDPRELPSLRALGIRYLSADDRQELHRAHAELYVRDAIPLVHASGEFGDQTVLIVSSPGRWGDEERKLALGWTEIRARLARECVQRIARDPGRPVGPFQLEHRATRQGFDVWALVSWQPPLPLADGSPH
jgi:hypothetical protein